MTEGVRVEPPEQRPLPLPRPKKELEEEVAAEQPHGLTPLPLPKPAARRRAHSGTPTTGNGRKVEGSPEIVERKAPSGSRPVNIIQRTTDVRRVPRLAGQADIAKRGTGTFNAPRLGGRRIVFPSGHVAGAPNSGTQRRPLTQRSPLATTRYIHSGAGTARLQGGAGTARLRSNSSGAAAPVARRPSAPRAAKRRSATPPPVPTATDEEAPAPATATAVERPAIVRNRTPGGGRRRTSSPPNAARKRSVPWGNRFIAALPLPPRHTGKKWTVVLDLDQTLVNAHGDDIVVQRPGLLAMLEKLGELGAERVLWTASNEAQVKFVLRRIGVSGQLFEYVVSWDTLGWTRPGPDVHYYKDLTKLRRPLSTTMLVDNDVRMVKVSPHNSLVVPDFGDGWGQYCSPKDQTLPYLTDFLTAFCEARVADHNVTVASFLRAHADWQRAEHGVPGHWALPFPEDDLVDPGSPPMQPA